MLAANNLLKRRQNTMALIQCQYLKHYALNSAEVFSYLSCQETIIVHA